MCMMASLVILTYLVLTLQLGKLDFRFTHIPIFLLIFKGSPTWANIERFGIILQGSVGLFSKL